MVLGSVVIPGPRILVDRTVFALEAYEIALFTAYWIGQTIENWNESIDMGSHD